VQVDAIRFSNWTEAQWNGRSRRPVGTRDPDRASGESQTRKGTGVWMPERRKETDGPGARLDPEVRSWIRNVIVPAMVQEYIAKHGSLNNLAEPIAVVPQCKANGRLSAEGIR